MVESSIEAGNNCNSHIKSIQFFVWNSDDVKKYAVAEINKSNLSGSGTVYDTRLGVCDNKSRCGTCLQSIIDCDGHWGFIALNVSVAHPLLYSQIIQYLKCFCGKCYRLRLTDDHIILMNLKVDANMSEQRKQIHFEKVLQHAEKMEFCPHKDCQSWLPDYFQKDGTICKYFGGTKSRDIAMTDEEISDIFSQIQPSELYKLGITSDKVHPCNLIIKNLPVLPICSRPCCITSSGNKDDDLTMKYIEIIKVNNKLAADNLTEGAKQNLTAQIKWNIMTLFCNDKGQAKQVNGRPIKALKTRISGKQGLLRWNLSGKRVDFSSRAVIGADVNLETDEIAVPYEIAKIQTFPERVFDKNLQSLKNLVDTGQANYVIRNGKKTDLNYVINNEFKIQTDDRILVPKTQNSDVSILNLILKSRDLDNNFDNKLNLIRSEYFDLTQQDTNDLQKFCDIVRPSQYQAMKSKPYILRGNDVVWRFNVLYFDLVKEQFRFCRGDVLYKKEEQVKIDVFGVKDGAPVFVYNNVQVSIESGDVIKRGNIKFGHCKIKQQANFDLKMGDIVERHLRTGDLIAFGRQPSLHKGSLIPRRVRILDENNSSVNNGNRVKTIRMNLAATKTYNADFDDKLYRAFRVQIINFT